jgi:hypothetical protein
VSYLVDANVLISAKRSHYRFGTFPCFWDWLDTQSAAGVVFSVEQVETEIARGNDELSTWIATRAGLFLRADATTASRATDVSVWANDPANGYTPTAIADFFAAADYWLVAHGVARGFTVVTHEAPTGSRKKIKIPDACSALGVTWINPFQMLEDLGANFR